jgi:hypothetical protein
MNILARNPPAQGSVIDEEATVHAASATADNVIVISDSDDDDDGIRETRLRLFAEGKCGAL